MASEIFLNFFTKFQCYRVDLWFIIWDVNETALHKSSRCIQSRQTRPDNHRLINPSRPLSIRERIPRALSQDLLQVWLYKNRVDDCYRPPHLLMVLADHSFSIPAVVPKSVALIRCPIVLVNKETSLNWNAMIICKSQHDYYGNVYSNV